jgi:hypothetical protein
MGKVLWGKCLGRTEDHVPSVVNNHVQPAILSNDLCNGGISRVLRLYIKLNRSQINLVLLREPVRPLPLAMRCVLWCLSCWRTRHLQPLRARVLQAHQIHPMLP